MTARQMPPAYPLDHGRGYCPLPRDARSFEPLMRSDNLLRVWVLLYARARGRAGWAAGSHGSVWLEPGQCACGVREVAAVLDVGKNTAQRALDQLERLGLISRNAGQRGSVISIVNYGAFGEDRDSGGDSFGDTCRDSLGDSSGDRVRDSLGDSIGDTPGDSIGDTPGDSSGDTPGDSSGDTPGDSSGPLRNRRTGEPEEGSRALTLSLVPPGDVKGKGGAQSGAGETRALHGRAKARKSEVVGGSGSDHERVKARWRELYRARYGTDPTWGGRQGAELKRLLDAHGCDQVIARAERLMTSPPDWLRDDPERGSFTFRTLFSNFDALSVAGGGPARAQVDIELEDARRRAAERSRGMPAFDEPLAGGKR